MVNDMTQFREFPRTSFPLCAKTNGALAVLCILIMLIAGCEFDNEIDGPSDSNVSISPSSVSLDATKTNIVEFTAAGGDNKYTWSMNNDALGIFYTASTNYATVLYQNTTNTGTNILTVRDSSSDYATARIIQK